MTKRNNSVTSQIPLSFALVCEMRDPIRLCEPYSVLARFLAVLLLTAAALKLRGMAADPVGRLGLFTILAFQIDVIELEVFLAGWLVRGKQQLGSQAMALGAFTVCAYVSAYQRWIGRASCSCIGKLSVGPWYAFGIDIPVLIRLPFCPLSLAAPLARLLRSSIDPVDAESRDHPRCQ